VRDFSGVVYVAKTLVLVRNIDQKANHHRHHLNLSLYPISYQGGAIIGVFMI
jgi:hypothetical protein